MAIIARGMPCSICKQPLRDGEAVVGSPHFIHEPSHHLWMFSDSGMHQSCFISWEHAAEFRTIFNERWNTEMPQFPREMLADGSIISKK